MIDKIKYLSVPLLVLAISYFIVMLLLPDFYPFGGVQIQQDEESIIQSSSKYLKQIGVKFEQQKLNIKFESNNNFIKWIQSEHKLDEANKILKENGSAYYWNINQKSENKNNIVVSSNPQENVGLSPISFDLSLLDIGKLIKFNQSYEDSTLSGSQSLDASKRISTDFIRLVRPDIILEEDSINAKDVDDKAFIFLNSETINKPGRIDYSFNWQTKSSNSINYKLITKISGDKLISFEILPIVPDEYLKNDADIFEIATTIILILLIIISVLIVGFKRFRAYEIGFKHAIIFGLFVLFSFVINEVLGNLNDFRFEIILGAALGGIFIAGAAFILWAVSETIFREIWNEKFLSVDLLSHKKVFHSLVGKSVLNGIAFGFGLFAVFTLLIYLTSFYSTLTFSGDNFTSHTHITSNLPLLNSFFGVFNAYGILAVGFLMFFTAAVKRYINNDTIFIIVMGLTWAVLVHSNINPITAGLPINLIIGILLTLILIKYDLLSTLLSYLLFKFFIKVTEFSFLQQQELNNQWLILIGICLVAIFTSIALIFRKDRFIEYDTITPKFVENITERQRLKKELDVARLVQMSFLPKDNPVLAGIDIASTCIPAFEVGGDYYDFINLGENKLGIIIGDVSGKGTQAAFYMTLTKGFLKALAKQTDSPAEVLTKMNELFYENVERGRFISMIYAIVDLNKKIIRIARAGHNPIILQNESGRIDLISPNGLALGLEKGNLFAKVITEHVEALTSGKAFIFYTDGFTEAVNKKGEEYGLEKMCDIVRLKKLVSAKDLQDKLLEDVNKFIGKASQHDDMTMVVLKIN